MRRVATEGFHPAVGWLLIETLAGMGGEGAEWLERIARDGRQDALLRREALLALPRERAAQVARSLVGADLPVCVAALLAMARAADPEALRQAREIVRPHVEGDRTPETPQRKVLVMTAARILAEWDSPDVGLLVRLATLGAQEPEEPPADVRRRIEEALDAYVGAVRTAAGDRESRLDALVDLVALSGLAPAQGEAARAGLRTYVREQAMPLLGRDNAESDRYAREVRDAIFRGLVRADDPLVLAMPYVPWVGAVVLELGRTGSAEAVDALAPFIEPGRPARAEACLALGATGRREAVPHLLRALAGDGGFVRYCAYLALRAITGRDHFADWIYGEASARSAAFEAYRASSAGNR